MNYVYILELYYYIPYEASWTDVQPVGFYGSKEDLKKEFETFCIKYKNKMEATFRNIKNIDVSNIVNIVKGNTYFNYNLYTLEEWLNQKGVKTTD